MSETYLFLTLLISCVVYANSTDKHKDLDVPVEGNIEQSELKSLLVQSFTERISSADSFREMLRVLEVDAYMKHVSKQIQHLTAEASENKALLNQVLKLHSKDVKCEDKNNDTIFKTKPTDCYDVLLAGTTSDGIQYIYPRSLEGREPIKVYCDMTTSGGGWTVIQRRNDSFKPRIDFFRAWSEYKFGFGLLNQEFWLGLENIHALTSSREYRLRIDLADFENQQGFAEYSFFSLGPEDEKYKMNVGTYSGDAVSGDSLTPQNGMKFSTKDQDNDVYGGECSVQFHGAWWYSNCHSANLNGRPYEGKHETYADGINWSTWKGHFYSLKMTELKVRPVYTS